MQLYGQGTMTYPDGALKYLGGFKDDKRHGRGTWVGLRKEKYVGEWCDDREHGDGTLYIPYGIEFWGSREGSRTVGEWKNGNYGYMIGERRW